MLCIVGSVCTDFAVPLGFAYLSSTLVNSLENYEIALFVIYAAEPFRFVKCLVQV